MTDTRPDVVDIGGLRVKGGDGVDVEPGGVRSLGARGLHYGRGGGAEWWPFERSRRHPRCAHAPDVYKRQLQNLMTFLGFSSKNMERVMTTTTTNTIVITKRTA